MVEVVVEGGDVVVVAAVVGGDVGGPDVVGGAAEGPVVDGGALGDDGAAVGTAAVETDEDTGGAGAAVLGAPAGAGATWLGEPVATPASVVVVTRPESASRAGGWDRGIDRGATASPPMTSRPAAAEPDSRRAGRRRTSEVSAARSALRSKQAPPGPQDMDKDPPDARVRPGRILAAMDASSVFRLRGERQDDVVRLWLAGDFDQTQRDTVIDALDEGDTPSEIQIDMSEVRFMGSSGLSALIHACRLLQPSGGRVVLIDPASPVVRLLDTCGLTHLFTIQLS